MEPDKQFEIQLGHICNNRCVFCVSGQMTELRRAAPIASDPVRTELDRAKALGMNKVTFLGGEPTIQRGFLENLQYAVSLGFEEVVIFTNGVRLRNKEWIDKVLAMGDTISWRISLQGGNEETHDFTTEKKGAFSRIVTGLETLSARGQKISMNMCVVEQNYRSLVDLPAMVAKYDVWQVHLDMVRPRDSGERTEEYLDGIMPDYTDLAQVLRTMLTGFYEHNPDFDINIGNLPYCLIPEWAHKLHHDGNLTYTVAVDGESQLSEPWDKYEDKKTDKIKLSTCETCAFDSKCSGFFDLYAKKRGIEAFKPVALPELREMDADQNLFTLLMASAVADFEAQPPRGWTVASLSEDEFQRRFDFVLADNSAGQIEFSLHPAAYLGGGDGEHHTFVIRLNSYNLPDHTAFRTLQEVFAHFAAHCPGDTIQPPATTRLQARRRTFGRDSMVPIKVQKRLRKLVQGAKHSDWRVLSTAPLWNQRGASAILRSATGDEASIFFIQNSEGRVQVSWDFPSGANPEAVQTMLQSVVQTLKQPTQAHA